MWATAPLPYYSAYKPARRKESSSNKDAASPTYVNKPLPLPLLSTHPDPNNLSELLEPALDGPPSPERIRALSKQMKRASALDKHKSSATTSSGSSSSLRSTNSDRPSWEHTLETITLSRKSSGRSTSGSMPSRDRPESVQLFGKTIFNRRAKMRRDSSAAAGQSSSGSSMYSGELAMDGPPSTNKDLIPSIFGRRRTLRQDALGEDPATLGRKLQISGPYNFQHVTHTNRDHLPDLQRGSRAELVTEFSAIRAGQRPTTGSLKGIDVEDLHFSNFSSEALHEQPEGGLAAGSETQAELFLNRPPPIPRQVTGPAPAPAPAPRRLVKHTRSQEQLRASPPRPAPPRPPRSPINEEAMPPPIPPARISGRVSVQQNVLDLIETAEAQERPKTSGGFQHPGSFQAPPDAVVDMPAIPPEFLQHDPELEVFTDPRFSHAITTPDDAAWPLTASSSFSYEMALPDVPEEEENYVATRRSRASMASTNSSLRGSQSVPALRQMTEPQGDEGQRPPSNASDTLGSFDMFAAQTALREALEVDEVAEVFHRTSWEDDIDYCYEHEAEADCDYAWDRPSLDMEREDIVRILDHDKFVAPLSAGLKPAPSGQQDIPALSPSSPTSTTNGHEAITPTIPALPVRSNFSHPRMETNYRGQSHLHVRTASHASSFKESHGFNLSPSLLIPGDFRQQMLAESDAEGYVSRRTHSQFSFEAEPTLGIETPGLFARDRASTSTTGSNSSEQTSSTQGRHTSTNSTWTALTRYTGSTTFEGWNPKAEGIDHARSFSVDEFPDVGSPKGAKPTMMTLPEAETLTTSQSTGDMRAVSERIANLSRESLPLTRSKEVKQHRRQRARTTSLSTPPPPGQYALFPPVYTGSRI